MATLTPGGYPTLAEVAGRLAPDGSLVPVTDVLYAENPMIQDPPWIEANQATGHLIQLTDTSYPDASYRIANRGTKITKGKTAQYMESCAVLEDISSVDELLVQQNGGAEWLRSERAIKLKALPQKFATELLYASASSNPEGIHGFMPRFQHSTGYDTSGQVIIGTNGGVDCRSILFVTWEPRICYCVYPKGTPAGLQVIDQGKSRIEDVARLVHWRFETLYRWNVGLAVEDYRYIVRCQYDPDDAAMAPEERGLIKMMSSALFKLHKITPRTRIYAGRETLELLDAQLMANENRQMQYVAIEGGKTIADPAAMGGERVPSFRGVPVRIADALVDETAVA